jgi:hypothetical protein
MAMRANFLRYDWIPGQDEAGQRRLQPQNWSPVAIGCPHISPAAMGRITLAPPGADETSISLPIPGRITGSPP